MAQGFKPKAPKAAKPVSKAKSKPKNNGPKPGARVIQPKKANAIASARIQNSLTKVHLKKIEASLVSKSKAAGAGSLRMIQPDRISLAAVSTTSKKGKKNAVQGKLTQDATKSSNSKMMIDSDC